MLEGPRGGSFCEDHKQLNTQSFADQVQTRHQQVILKPRLNLMGVNVLSLAEWNSVCDEKPLSSFDIARVKKSMFTTPGVPDSHRGLLWTHLLQAHATQKLHFCLYSKLCKVQTECMQHLDDNFVKDKIGERSKLVENKKFYTVDPEKLRRIVTAYGSVDETAAKCYVGYNYIVTLLCRFIAPKPEYDLNEELVFWSLFALMQDLGWRDLFISQKVKQEFTEEFQQTFRIRYDHLYTRLENELGYSPDFMLESLVSRYFEPIFCYGMPIEITKHIVDWFLWHRKGLHSLSFIFFRSLDLMQAKIDRLTDQELDRYMQDC